MMAIVLLHFSLGNCLTASEAVKTKFGSYY